MTFILNIDYFFQVEALGRLVQDKLSHQLDEVEVSIAQQVAQKSQHFFQVSANSYANYPK